MSVKEYRNESWCKSMNKKKGLSMRQKQNATGWLFLVPVIILICGFSIYPMISALITSFKTGIGTNMTFTGLTNYIRCFKDDVFIQSLKNCLFYLIIQVPVMLILALVLASDAECILCMDDNICMIVLRILRKKGIQIPERIKVASLHNSSLLDEWYPPVSCIHFDVDELGKEASRILYVYLTENKRLPKSVLGYELQMKASTN